MIDRTKQPVCDWSKQREEVRNRKDTDSEGPGPILSSVTSMEAVC